MDGAGALTLYLWLFVGLVAASIVAWLYNRLVSARMRVREAWSIIEVQLQRRASLIPNLVETVKGYASYERETLNRVVQARSALSTAAAPGAAASADAQLTSSLRTLFAVVEAYPELKANERFAQLQSDLADTENKIAYARNYYNGAVQQYNTQAQSFPALLIAVPFGFRPAEFFTADDAAPPEVNVGR